MRIKNRNIFYLQGSRDKYLPPLSGLQGGDDSYVRRIGLRGLWLRVNLRAEKLLIL